MCSAQPLKYNVSDSAWKQAQLGLMFRGLGLHSLSCHAAATFIASLSSSGLGLSNNHHLQQAVIAYKSIPAESANTSPTSQIQLSSKIDKAQFLESILHSQQSPTSVRFCPSCSFMAISGPFHGLYRPTHGVQ